MMSESVKYVGCRRRRYKSSLKIRNFLKFLLDLLKDEEDATFYKIRLVSL